MLKPLLGLVALVLPATVFAAPIPTTAEQQLAGCPAVIESVSVTTTRGGKTNAIATPRLSSDCHVAIYGDRKGDDNDDNDGATQ